MTTKRSYVAATAMTLAVALLAGSAGAAIAQSTPPKVDVLGEPGLLFFDVPCVETDAAPVSITITGNGATGAFTLDKPCGTWTGSLSGAPNIKARTHAQTFDSLDDYEENPLSRLELEAVGTKATKRSYSYAVTVAGAPQSEGTINVQIINKPNKKIHKGTDAFQNYCRNRHRPIKSKNGRLYCVRPGEKGAYITTNDQ